MRCTVISLCAVVCLVGLGLACATEQQARDGDPSCNTCPPARARVHPPGDDAVRSMLGAASPTALPEGVNAVQNEMRLLDHAVHQSITAAALGDVSIVPALFHQVHQAKALTERALVAGTWKPAKGDLAGFTALDQAFHVELEKVVEAASKNDRTAVVDALDRLLPSCIACHDAHRESGLPASMKPAPAAHPEHPKGGEHPEHPKGGEHPEHPKGSEHPEHPKG